MWPLPFVDAADSDPSLFPARSSAWARGAAPSFNSLPRAAKWRGARRIVWLAILAAAVFASSASTGRAEQLDLPPPDIHEPLQISADRSSRWTEGVYDVWLLTGHCAIDQGPLHARSDRAVLWIERGGPAGNPPYRTLTYLEGNVTAQSTAVVQSGNSTAAAPGTSPTLPPLAKPAPTRLSDQHWYTKLFSTQAPAIRTATPEPEPTTKPDVYRSAVVARGPVAHPEVQRAQFGARNRARGVATPVAGAAPPTATPGTRRIRFFPRSDQPLRFSSSTTNPATNEQSIVFSSGVNVIVDGLSNFGSIDVSADRVVIWTAGLQSSTLTGETLQADEMPLEIYLEGNVVFRQGERTIYSPAMYYDVQQNVGVVLQAELLTPLPTPKYPGKIRLRADVLRQIDSDRFVAQNASFTSSRLGDPTFELRAGTAVFEDVQTPEVNFFTRAPEIDPLTGQPRVQHAERVTAQNDVLYFEGIPVFYWPTFATDLERDNFFINKAEIKSDQVFGTQVITEVDLYQLFGVRNPPRGTTLDGDLEYMSKRGFALGEDFRFDQGEGIFGGGRTVGSLDTYFLIHDSGLDNLGADRPALVPEQKFRGRALGQYRQKLSNDWQITAELGYQTDRNFLEEYFNREFDTLKDLNTDVELRRNLDNMSLTILASGRLNDVYTETQWLPRLDHFWLGQPLAEDTLTWYEHTSLAYAQQNVAATPTDKTDAAKFTQLPWESPRLHGQRLATRNEIDWPVQWGPFKIVPYGLGEIANWGEDLDHQDFNRAYGVLGIRASIPFWAIDPTIQDDYFNVHGMAHKVVLSVDASTSQSTDNLAHLPLYDQLEDESVQHFERRFAFNTFGVAGLPTFPAKFDPRYYALRRGSDEWVTGPTEIAGNQTVVRLDADQRWQTKRGPIGDQHILDYVTLDTSAEVFPEAKQNFGSNLGLVDYDFHWFVGDRLTVVSDGMFDFFGDGQKEASIGMFLSRPPRGSFYAGFYSLGGPIRAEVIALSYSYRMTPKWASTFSTTFNVSPSLDIGQSFSITRIGESFLVSLGVSYDDSRHTAGASLMIEPRALGRSRAAKAQGFLIPPAGATGLE